MARPFELTPSQTVGPFFSIGLCVTPSSELVEPSDPEAVKIAGRVFDGDGEPVSDAMVEIWQADDSGEYRGDFGWGRCGTDAEGSYAFVTRKPGRVADEAGGLQAPHLNVAVFARGLLKQVTTRMYFPDEAEANAEDRILGALAEEQGATLVARPAVGALEFDLRLQGERQTAFFVV